MPGIVDAYSVGLHREVGKMTCPNQNQDVGVSLDVDFTAEEAATLEEFAQFLASENTDDVLDSVLSDSAPSSSSSSPSRDNNESEGELPESENAFDLDKLWDSREFSGILLNDHFEVGECSSLGECNSLGECKLKQPSSNPFMGMQDISPSETLLNHTYSLDDHPHPQQSQNTERFVAWGHTPSDDDEHLLMLISPSSINDDSDEILPDTPSSYSGTVTGDDSDVDIETITDTPPRTADFCGYVTQDSSPALSPATSPSPLQNHATSNISSLHRSSSSPQFSSCSNSSKPLIRFNSCGVSNSASLAENLMCGRPTVSGQKRKVQKEKKCLVKTTSYPQATVYQTSGASLNFHDYAMSPISCMSLDTAQPTVITSKRLCKRKQLNTLDLSEKEKQHHHNQLERNRRQKLADLFIDLRDEVPPIAHQTKASKVMILNQATAYIEELQSQDSSQSQEISRELERNQFLRRQKRQLESQLSSVK